jgi:cytoskeletal protein CcmA (bactofilin family)
MFGGKPLGDAREGMTLIAEEAFFHGSLVAKGSLRVEGRFEGDITDAVNVAAESVVLAGEIVGDVVASRSVELLPGARLTGDVRTPKIRIDEGAFFEGACAMGAGEDKPRARRRRDADAEPRSVDPVS